jgi:hypothetical protein
MADAAAETRSPLRSLRFARAFQRAFHVTNYVPVANSANSSGVFRPVSGMAVS